MVDKTTGRFLPRDIRRGDKISWWGQGSKLETGVVEDIGMPRGRIHIKGRKHAILAHRVIGVTRGETS